MSCAKIYKAGEYNLPSEKILEVKKQQLSELKTKIDASCVGVLVDYKGITVAEDTALRKELREAGVSYTVEKNTLLSLAFKGTSLEGLDSALSGSTALAVSESDYAAAARILAKFAEKQKNKNFSIKGGFIDGEVIGLDKVDELAKLPTREVLLSTVVFAFQAPIAAFARALQAVVDKKGAPAEEAAAPVEEAAAPAEEAAAPVEEAAAPAEEAAPAE